MQRIESFIKEYWPFIILIALEVILFATNYTPGTYLIGWDNLFPEFYFGLNIKRSLFAIWQEYRGLGLLDGMSHAANLVHYIFLFLLSFFLPQSLLRYTFIFLTHILGGIGMYLLLSNYILHNENNRLKKVIALLGALFYQYNLATVQMYFLPFELFVTHFTALPWSFYILQKFINQPSRRNLILLFIVLFLSTPQAHVPSVFIVYAFALGIFLLFVLLQNGLKVLKSVLVAFLLIFLANSFWGIPYLYSTINNARTIAESKNNQMGTDDIFLRNQKYGDFQNVALLRGLSLDFVQYDYKQQVSGYMMEPWRKLSFSPVGVITGWVFFSLTLFGMVYAIVKKQRLLYRFIFLWIITFLILGNDIPVLGFFSYFLRTYIPYFYNVFRFVFTKFSFLYVAMYSIFFAYGLYILTTFIYERSIKQAGLFFIALITLILGFSSYPSFQGNFFHKNLRVEIPKEYFDTFKFFQKQDVSERIAILPAPWFWAWTQTGWGTIGSGFMWFGIQQPTLDRAFDPWSNTNENYYWELTQAIYSQDRNLFEKLLEKYQVSWLLIDKNILQPSSPKAIYTDQIEEMINQSGKFSESISFGKIKIYKVNLEIKPKDFVFLASDLPIIEPSYKWNNSDHGYLEYGNYISDSSTPGESLRAAPGVSLGLQVYYPFRSLFTGRRQEELEFEVEDQGEYFSFSTIIPKELEGAKLVIPALSRDEITEIDENDLSKTKELPPQIFLGKELIERDSSASAEIVLPYIKEGDLEVRVPKIRGYYSYDIEPRTMNLEPRTCDQFNKGVIKYETISEAGKELLRLTSIGSSNCLDFDLPRLSQKLGYLVTVENRNVEGKSLLFAVINKNSQRSDLETYLPNRNDPQISSYPLAVVHSYFVISPMEQYGLGYVLHLDNISIGRERTINDLGRIAVNPIPYRFLTGLKIVNNQTTANRQQLTDNYQLDVKHPNPSYYQITLDPSTIGGVPSTSLGTGMASQAQPATPEVYLTLSQSFDKGWRAYEIVNDWLTDSWYMKLLIPVFGKEIKDHVLVNNWENGWNLKNPISIRQLTDKYQKDNITIVIIYLPQYLQYLGFAILIFIPLIIYKIKST